nr:hypothetical protein [uncultured Flavobacterium sp.]
MIANKIKEAEYQNPFFDTYILEKYIINKRWSGRKATDLKNIKIVHSLLTKQFTNWYMNCQYNGV